LDLFPVVNALIEIVWDLSFMHMTPCGSDDSVDKLQRYELGGGSVLAAFAAALLCK
jgi:hypothetical protein